MDDYSLTALSDSKNEWCARLINLLTPAVIEGLRSIFTEAWNLCNENDEDEKYLMTFQTFLSRVPKWNEAIIEAERTRIEESTNCGYLEELITCVHIIQLKALTCVRVGTEQKKVDINIPSRNEFIHRVYINAARKLYTVVYLFEKDIAPLQMQKNNRELELIVKECILNSVRDTMPVEEILRAYIDETEEENVTEVVIPVEEEVEEIKNETDNQNDDTAKEVSENASENVPDKNTDTDNKIQNSSSPTSNMEVHKSSQSAPLSTVQDSNAAGSPATPTTTPVTQIAPQIGLNNISEDNVKFNDTDNAIDTNGIESNIVAPKTDERLERIAAIAAERRKEEEEDEDDDHITIGNEVKLEIEEINDLNKPATVIPPILDDIEVLK